MRTNKYLQKPTNTYKNPRIPVNTGKNRQIPASHAIRLIYRGYDQVE